MEPKKQLLTEEVYQKIKDAIIYGKLAPGDILTVGELAEKFKVSKTPVRESLNALKHEGLIEVLPYKGYLVARVDVKVLLDLFQIRLILETAAAEIVGNGVGLEWIEKLTELAITPVNKNDPDYTVLFMKTNYNFHTAIAKASGNQYLYKYVSNTLNLLQRVLYSDLLIHDSTLLEREHLELVNYIRGKDSAGVRKSIVSQIEASKNRVLKIF
ncbi:MAG: GntR family transcriptional regulator [Desulfitobacteriaceae bacterium]